MRHSPPRYRRSRTGNALMEYAVPAAMLLLTAGVAASALDAKGSIAGYFLAASGHTQTALTGGVFKTIALEGPGYGSTGNGQTGFTALATLMDGNNQVLPSTATGFFYNGSVSRAGNRVPSPSPEYLYRAIGLAHLVSSALPLSSE